MDEPSHFIQIMFKSDILGLRFLDPKCQKVLHALA